MQHKKAIGIFLIFSLAFLFRSIILFYNEYPPSTDIGLHSNIINLILINNEIPNWNPFHMGGEPLVSSPGFHLYAYLIVDFTGLPLLVVQPLLAAFFSAYGIFGIFLLSRHIWKSDSAAIFAAFLVMVSSLSLEMLGWGGYPNVFSISLIALIFYNFLKNKDNFSGYIASGLLLSGVILVHIFSFFVLLVIALCYILLLLIRKILFKSVNNTRVVLKFSVITVVLGFFFVSPWLLRTYNFNYELFSQSISSGVSQETKNLFLINRFVDVRFLALVLVIFPMFIMLKLRRQRYVDEESLLIVSWFLAPLFLTQAHVFGIFVDYARFAYFADFPGLLMFSAFLFLIFRFSSKYLRRTEKISIKFERVKKPLKIFIILLALLLSYFFIPFLVTSLEALKRIDYYTSVKEAEASAMFWIKDYSAVDSVLVSDHLYGWWLSGVALRTTLSAVSPEFLIYPYEVEVAKAASVFLDTEYYIDNGLIEVREDGGYLGRHNPIFIVKRTQHLPYSVFHFNDDEITIFLERENFDETIDLNDISNVTSSIITYPEENSTLLVARENNFIRITKTITVKKGERFAKLAYTIESTDNETDINWIRYILHLRKGIIEIRNSSINLFDYDAMVIGKIIFHEGNPEAKIYTEENPSSIELLYPIPNSKSTSIELLIGLYDVGNYTYEKILKILNEEPKKELSIATNKVQLTSTSYLGIMNEYTITHVVSRDQSTNAKFHQNPKFSLLYKNDKISIFYQSNGN